MATGITNALVDYAQALKYEDIPPEVLERTKQMLLDFLGVAYGGLRTGESSGPPSSTACWTSRPARQGRARCLDARSGSPRTTPRCSTPRLPTAWTSTTPTATLSSTSARLSSPRLLALADEHDVSGRDFLTAAVVGYDVTGKVGKAHGGSMHARGFHPTATTGIFGCSAAGARLLGYSARQTANAMGLNVSQSAGSTQFLENGSWNKRFHTGLAGAQRRDEPRDGPTRLPRRDIAHRGQPRLLRALCRRRRGRLTRALRPRQRFRGDEHPRSSRTPVAATATRPSTPSPTSSAPSRWPRPRSTASTSRWA